MEAASRECDGIGGCTIEEVRVIDDREDGPSLRSGRGQKAKDASTDRESFRWLADRKAQRSGERVLLWPRQSPTSIHDRAEQIVQPGVGDLRLRLESLGSKHAETWGCRGTFQQRCLADPRFTAQDERAAPTATRGVEQGRDSRLFDRTPDEHGVMILMRRLRPASSIDHRGGRHFPSAQDHPPGSRPRGRPLPVFMAASRRRLRRGPRTQRARTGGVPGLDGRVLARQDGLGLGELHCADWDRA